MPPSTSQPSQTTENPKQPSEDVSEEASGKTKSQAPAPGKPAVPRPPGEIGGHTVQPAEQDATAATKPAGSRDTPPPEQGAKEAQAQGPGPGAKTTAAPGNQPSGATSGHGRSGGSTPGQGSARPARPPAKGQAVHEPSPPPKAAEAQGQATDGDALVEAITKALAGNLAKALHQSIAQAVGESLPQSGRPLQPSEAPSDERPAASKAPSPPANASAAPKDQAPANPRGPDDSKGPASVGKDSSRFVGVVQPDPGKQAPSADSSEPAGDEAPGEESGESPQPPANS